MRKKDWQVLTKFLNQYISQIVHNNMNQPHILTCNKFRIRDRIQTTFSLKTSMLYLIKRKADI